MASEAFLLQLYLEFRRDNMMLDVFTQPDTVTCVLCRATVSIRKGDKARFFNHISHDHEVHYDMELFYVLSFLNMEQKKTVIDIINEKLLSPVENINVDERIDITETEDENNGETSEVMATDETLSEAVQNGDDSSSLQAGDNKPSSYLQIIQKFYENSKKEKETDGNVDDTNVDKSVEVTKSKPVEEMSPSKRKEKCTVCDIMVSRKNMRIHMRVRHKAESGSSADLGLSEFGSTGKMKKIEGAKKIGTIGKWNTINKKIVVCSFCSKTLRKDSRRRHMRMVHKISKEDLERMNLEEPCETKKSNTENDSDKDARNIKREKVESQEPSNTDNISKKKKQKDYSKEGSEEAGYRKCKLCFKRLKNSFYRRHLKDAHSGKQNKCEICYFVLQEKTR